MIKKQNLASYPTPHAELLSAIDGANAVAAKISRINDARDRVPSELSQIANCIIEAESQRARKEAEAVLSDSPELREERASLTATIVQMREEEDSLARRPDALDAAGVELNAEMKKAQATLNAERQVYANRIQNVLADDIVGKGGEMAELYGLYRLFAPVSGMSSGWLESAYISDPREAVVLGLPGSAYDSARNLLKQTGTELHATAFASALEPLASAQRLLNIQPYKPRVQTNKATGEKPRRTEAQTEVPGQQHLRAGHSPNRI